MDYRTSKFIILLVRMIPYVFKEALFRASKLALQVHGLKKWIFLLPIFYLGILETSYSQVSLFADELEAKEGQVVDFPILISGFKDIFSMQFSLNWDTTVLEFKEVHSYTENLPQFNKESIGITGVSSGKLVVVWFDNSLQGISITDSTELIRVKFEVIGQEGEASAISFSDVPAVIEFVDASSTEVEADLVDGAITIPEILISSTKFLQSPNGMRLFQNHPNPFNKHTTIQLFFNTVEWVTFTVTDAHGRPVYSDQFRSIIGHNDIQFSNELLPAAGIYNYTIQSEAYQLSRQMILLP